MPTARPGPGRRLLPAARPRGGGGRRRERSVQRVTPVVVTRFGEPAFTALRDALADVRGGDPMAPVDVAVPSSFAGVTIRRRLANPGLVGVRFAPLPRVIANRALPVLATAGILPLTSAHRHAAARAVLASSGGGLADSARRSASTIDVVTGVFAELDESAAGGDAIEMLAAGGRWPAELAGLYRRYLDLVAEFVGPEQLAEAALTSTWDTPLIIYLPRRLTRIELGFCDGLADRGQLRVVLALTGEQGADRDALAIRDALAPTAGAVSPPPPPRAQTRALPDPEEEARYAVRRIFAHLARQPGACLDRVAVAYRAAAPYARLVSEQLSAAELPHHAPRQRALSGTVPGRTLLGLLRLPGRQWSRVAVLDWLRAAPVRDGGTRLPTATWQRQAAEAGVTRGPAGQWAAKLDRLAARTEQVSAAEGETWPVERAADARALAGFVTDAARRVDEINAAGTWGDAARLLGQTLDHYLGGAAAATSWGAHAGTSADGAHAGTSADGAHADARADPEVRARCDVERSAYEETLAVIDGLAGLDDVGLPVDAGTLRDVLGQELTHRVREAAGLGRGVLVGPLPDVVGADLDLLIIVGAAEGSYPPRGHEHPLLRDGIRAEIGLRTLADRRAAERRDHLGALASAAVVVLTHPVADTRAQRGVEPAPWLLEQTDPRLTSREETQTAPASFQASVCDSGWPAGSRSEYDVRLAIPAAPLASDHPLVTAVPALARGLAAAQQRSGGVFGPWTGGLTHPVPDTVTARLEGTLSATSLQLYAECPLHYYLEYVLGIRPVEEPDEDKADAAERGSAVHEVLERLVRGAIDAGKAPAEPWSEAEHTAAQRMLAEQADRMLAEGKAGRPIPWAVQMEQGRRQLRQVLLADDAYRAARGARPRDVEHAFGRDDHPPLVLDLPGGQVRLSGSIDRIDQTSDGELVVIDYKTGRSKNYEAFPRFGDAADAAADLTERGKKLQLPLYALAARQDYGAGATPVSAYYWFVDEGEGRRGGPVGEPVVDRFHDVVDVLAEGIRDGAFPARPGAFGQFYRSFESCTWCQFDRVCSQTRDDVWERIRDDTRVSRYAGLAEPADGSSA
jgi:ATP-dependent helicase/nuclease subunit B